jgi:hypothetical protein
MKLVRAAGIFLLFLAFGSGAFLAAAVAYDPVRRNQLTSNSDFQRAWYGGDSKTVVAIRSKVETQSTLIVITLGAVYGIATIVVSRQVSKHRERPPVIYIVLFGVLPSYLAFYGWKNVDRSVTTEETRAPHLGP